MATNPVQALTRDDPGEGLQFFAVFSSIAVAVDAVLSSAKPLLAPMPGRTKAVARKACSAAGGAVRAAGSAALTRARLVGGGTVEAAHITLKSLGFDRSHDSRAAAWRVLRHGVFCRFFIASMVTNWGTWLQNSAQVLLAYRFSHSVLTVGLVTCTQFSTPLICGPWASIVADRIGARRTLIITQIASAVITAVMAILQFTNSLSEVWLFSGAFAVGLMFAFALPAQSALIPALVPEDSTDSKAAVVMNSVSYNAGRMVAPAFTVLIVMMAGFWCVFALNAVTFAIFVGVLRKVKPLSVIPTSKKSRVRDGLRVVKNDRRIGILLLIVSAVTLAEDPVLVLGPGLARHAFHVSYDCSGYFLCALGAGSVFSSMVPRRKSPSIRRTAAALGLLGISIMTFALAPWMLLSVVAAFSAGLCGLIAGSAAQAMLRQLAGKELALQVMGLWAVAWAGSKPFASLLDGLLPSVISVQITGVVMAIPALIPSVVLVGVAVAQRLIGADSKQGSLSSRLFRWFTGTAGENIATEVATASWLPTVKKNF